MKAIIIILTFFVLTSTAQARDYSFCAGGLGGLYEVNDIETIIDELESENRHTEVLILESFKHGRFDLIQELCDIETEYLELGYLSDELLNRRLIINNKLKNNK